MDPAVILTLVISVAGVIFASITAPLILAHRTERMHREDMLSDYQRQDKVAAAVAETARAAAEQVRGVAAQAAEAASVLQAAQAESIRRTDEVARLAEQQAARAGAQYDETNGKLDVIHGLVNSTLSAALQSELDALVTSLAMMREVMDLKKSGGLDPAEEAVIAFHATEAKITELRVTLADRLKQAEVIAAQSAKAVAVREDAVRAVKAKAVPHG
jgi:phage-related protein